ncbi:hypothetical protein FB451DRAFT_1565890 [Mycena latifolia]|nr:hypothetical protein FB451DRAFT_1565890 [Mycena latifolia]
MQISEAAEKETTAGNRRARSWASRALQAPICACLAAPSACHRMFAAPPASSATDFLCPLCPLLSADRQLAAAAANCSSEPSVNRFCVAPLAKTYAASLVSRLPASPNEGSLRRRQQPHVHLLPFVLRPLCILRVRKQSSGLRIKHRDGPREPLRAIEQRYAHGTPAQLRAPARQYPVLVLCVSSFPARWLSQVPDSLCLPSCARSADLALSFVRQVRLTCLRCRCVPSFVHMHLVGPPSRTGHLMPTSSVRRGSFAREPNRHGISASAPALY